MLSVQLKEGDRIPNFTFDTPWQAGVDFYETIQERDALFVFLRYHGCPICQMEMANLKRDFGLFDRKGVRIFVFLQSAIETVAPLVNRDDFPFDIVCDPQGKIFQLYGVEPGGVLRYLHPAGLIAVIKATFRGFFHKKFEGHETQLPAAFIINKDKTLKYAYYGKNVSDVPGPSILAMNLG